MPETNCGSIACLGRVIGGGSAGSAVTAASLLTRFTYYGA